MNYLMTMLMSIIVLTFVACGDKSEDTADTAVEDAVLSDTSEGQDDAGEQDAGDDQDGGTENE